MVVFAGLKQAQVTALVVFALTIPIMVYLLLSERRGRHTEQARSDSRAEKVAT